MMRPILAVALTMLVLFSMVACSDHNHPESSNAPDASASVNSETSETLAPESSATNRSEVAEEPESSETQETKESENSEEPEEPMPSKQTQGLATTTNKAIRKTTSRRRPLVTTTTIADTTATTETKEPSFVLPTEGDWEKPVTENIALQYSEQHSRFDDEAEAMRQRILGAPDTLKAADGCKTYYISYRGDDTNNGLSPQTPWKTTTRLQMLGLFNSGDVVLFERGGVYRDVSVHTVSGVSYGAYGEGPKPQLLGSDKNYADESLWTKTNHKNVWRTKLAYTINFFVSDGRIEDVGNIIFDHGKICASDGKQYHTNQLETDYDFYYDKEMNYLYLYLSKGNPAALHESIEIATNEHIFSTGYGGNNITFENLCLRYGGAHGISTSSPQYITVRGCEIGYIGGGLLNKSVRFGNGVEFAGDQNNCTVENCWIYHCYDAGYTNQGDGWHRNVTVKNNLIEYCQYNIEVWTVEQVGEGGMIDCTFSNNILRFAGYSFGSNNRLGSDASAVGNFSTYGKVIPCENTIIKNNIFDCSIGYVICNAYPNDKDGRGPTIRGNTWVQKPHKNLTTGLEFTVKIQKIEPRVGYTLTGGHRLYHCRSLSDFKDGIAAYDKNPTAVYFDE